MSFLKKVTGIFRHTPPEDNFDSVKRRVQGLLALEVDKEGLTQDHRDQIEGLLGDLYSEIEKVKQAAGGYPNGPISGLTWFNGSALADMCRLLSKRFAEIGLLSYEESSTGLWCRTTLSVMSHYHHLVGPAMLANANCNERLGRFERATDLYSAIIEDFSPMIDDWAIDLKTEEEGYCPGESHASLCSLKEALERYLDLSRKTSSRHENLLAKVRQVLSTHASEAGRTQ